MDKRILISTCVRQREEIFLEYLNSLNHLVIPNGYVVNKFFYFYNCPELTKHLKENEFLNAYSEKESKEIVLKNYATIRTAILKKARDEKYDYLFMVDDDILLHPKTLTLLLKDNADIIGNALWIKIGDRRLEINGNKDEERGQYSNLEHFKIPGVYEIGWTQYCTLISNKIFNNPNISYYTIPDVDSSQSQEYAFCLRAKCNFPDLKILLDTRLPARSLYMENEYSRWMQEKKIYE